MWVIILAIFVIILVLAYKFKEYDVNNLLHMGNIYRKIDSIYAKLYDVHIEIARVQPHASYTDDL